jgi:hypothetical protein
MIRLDINKTSFQTKPAKGRLVVWLRQTFQILRLHLNQTYIRKRVELEWTTTGPRKYIHILTNTSDSLKFCVFLLLVQVTICHFL